MADSHASYYDATTTAATATTTATGTIAATVAATIGVEELGRSLQQFGWLDYVFFVAMLLICILIGVYFGFIKKVDSTQEYLAGGRNMLVTPISMSLIASYISGITLLGLPADVYRFGMQYAYVAFGILFTGLAMNYIYLPVFLNLNITSTYEYLELRFDKKVRLFGSVLYTIGNIAYLPIVIYVPALAFNQVTGVNVHVITPIVCLVCIFYTCVGGLKAVVWTDVIQTVGMFGSIILVIIKGTVDVGGVGVVVSRSWESGRLEAPDPDPSPTARHTAWTVIVGGCITWLQSNAVSQNMIQRYIALPTLKSARRAAWILVIGVALLITTCSYCGLLMYATYHDCDPLTTKLARVKDQMLPLFVMRTLSGVPGLSGLFIAGVFSAALSSLSTCLNSMSAIVLEDFVKPVVAWRRRRDRRRMAMLRGEREVVVDDGSLTDRQTWYLMRCVVVLVGTLCVSLVMLVERGGTVFQLTASVESITCGPLLGLFTAGMLLPWINAKGALAGGISGLTFMTWLCMNAQAAISSGHITWPTKPLSAHGCDYTFNTTAAMTASDDASVQQIAPITDEVSDIAGGRQHAVFALFRVSYLWYSLLGASVTALTACAVSLVFRDGDRDRPTQPSAIPGGDQVLPPQRRKVNANLLAPCVRRFYYPEYKSKSKEMESTESTEKSERTTIMLTTMANVETNVLELSEKTSEKEANNGFSGVAK